MGIRTAGHTPASAPWYGSQADNVGLIPVTRSRRPHPGQGRFRRFGAGGGSAAALSRGDPNDQVPVGWPMDRVATVAHVSRCRC
jgi:hypothetical protein